MSDLFSPDCHSFCVGCPVLDQKKLAHSRVDYDQVQPVKVLFLGSSYRVIHGQLVPFSPLDCVYLDRAIERTGLRTEEYAFSPAVKCPGVNKLNAAGMKACRQHLYKTVEAYNPELIVVCGALALQMLRKRAGLNKVRGRLLSVDINGTAYNYMPVEDPFTVHKNRERLPVFLQDIERGWKTIKGELVAPERDARYPMTSQAVCKEFNLLWEAEPDLTSVDIETYGFDFVNDPVMSFSITYGPPENEVTFAFPWKHKDFEWDSVSMSTVYYALKKFLETHPSKKVFHNARFDLKFIKRQLGITTKNVSCSMLLAKLINEELPAGLSDLINLHFPNELS